MEVGSQGSQAAIEISCKNKLVSYKFYTLHSAVPQPGRLLQQPHIASNGFTEWNEGGEIRLLVVNRSLSEDVDII